MKKNCWEFKKCGREPGGDRVDELGVCPAATEDSVDGINEGKKGGRSCWAITGTYCTGIVEGRFASKVETCLQCDFYRIVRDEQGESFQGTALILARLKDKESGSGS
jgi:hypothetical protein